MRAYLCGPLLRICWAVLGKRVAQFRGLRCVRRGGVRDFRFVTSTVRKVSLDFGSAAKA